MALNTVSSFVCDKSGCTAKGSVTEKHTLPPFWSSVVVQVTNENGHVQRDTTKHYCKGCTSSLFGIKYEEEKKEESAK